MAISLMGPGSPAKKLMIRTFSAGTLDSNNTRSVEISIASVPGYQSLTVDNIYIVQAGINPKSTAYSGVIRRSYDASTGKVTISESAGSSLSFMNPVQIAVVTMEDE